MELPEVFCEYARQFHDWTTNYNSTFLCSNEDGVDMFGNIYQTILKASHIMQLVADGMDTLTSLTNNVVFYTRIAIITLVIVSMVVTVIKLSFAIVGSVILKRNKKYTNDPSNEHVFSNELIDLN